MADERNLVDEEDAVKENSTKNLRAIRENGMNAGLAIKPATDWKEVIPYLPLCDMTDHHRLRSRLNQSAVNLSVGCIPLVTGETVHTGKNMLIHLIAAISRKMFNCNKYIFFFCSLYIINTTC